MSLKHGWGGFGLVVGRPDGGGMVRFGKGRRRRLSGRRLRDGKLWDGRLRDGQLRLVLNLLPQVLLHH
jgi:hypothetical protein